MVCRKCGECCKTLIFKVNATKTYDDDFIRYYAAHKVKIERHGEQYWFIVKNRCKYLSPNNLCKIWNRRPNICRNTKSNPDTWVPDDCTDKYSEVKEDGN